MPKPKPSPTRLNLHLDSELHRQFKSACAFTGKTMSDVVIEFIRSYVDAHLPKPQAAKPVRR